MTFSVMMRGYGDSDPPQWTAISALLGVMQSRYQMKPSTGAATQGLGSIALIGVAPACICGEGALQLSSLLCCPLHHCHELLVDLSWRSNDG